MISNLIIYYYYISCELQIHGWEYVETCFASLYLLYSFWMSTLVSTTAAEDETAARSRIKFMLSPANSGWIGSSTVDITQLDYSVSAASCSCVHSALLPCRYIIVAPS